MVEAGGAERVVGRRPDEAGLARRQGRRHRARLAAGGLRDPAREPVAGRVQRRGEPQAEPLDIRPPQDVR